MAGLLRGMARTAAFVGTANAVNHRQQQRWAQQQQPEQGQQPQPVVSQPMPQSGDTDDQIAQLQKLAQLKDQGILTQAEFDAKKAQILGL